MREAGALALSLFRTELKKWTKGASSPVSEADIAVNDLLERRLRSRHTGLWLAVGRKRRRRVASRTSDWSGSSIRSTAPVAISPAAKTGASAWRWSRMPCRCWRPCLRLPATSSSLPRAGRAPRATVLPVHATSGTELDFSRVAGPKPLVERLEPVSGTKSSCIPELDRWRFGCAGSREGSLDAAFAGGQSRDWDLAAANLIVQEANGNMTALSGERILYNRRGSGARGAGGSGARSSCAHRRAFSKPSVALNASRAASRSLQLACRAPC